MRAMLLPQKVQQGLDAVLESKVDSTKGIT
jgi:hypothetical protein